MLKSILTATVFASALIVPALATEMKCDDATMTMMEKQMKGMKDMAMKDKAMQEMGMAKDAMKMMKMDDCMKHMENTRKTMQ